MNLSSRSRSTAVHLGPPERSFGVRNVRFDDSGTSVDMCTGVWNRFSDGVPSVGSLGVLLDSALGYEAGRWSFPDVWLVTRELYVDILGPIPEGAETLTATADSLPPTGRAGYGRCKVVGEGGRVIATAATWVRYGAMIPSVFLEGAPSVDHPPAADAEIGVGGEVTQDDGIELRLEVGAATQNPAGNLHGGICFAAATISAERYLRRHRPTFVVNNAHVVFIGAGTPGATIDFRVREIHLGRSAGLLAVTAMRTDGAVVAYATVSAQLP